MQTPERNASSLLFRLSFVKFHLITMIFIDPLIFSNLYTTLF